MPATRARIIRRAPATRSVQQHLHPQQNLNLAVDGNYMNNIDTDEVIRHLYVGTADQYKAAQFLEAAFDAEAERLEDKHLEEDEDLKARYDADLLDIDTALTNAIFETDCERITPAEFQAEVQKIADRIRIMYKEECSYDKANLYIDGPVVHTFVPKKKPVVNKKAKA